MTIASRPRPTPWRTFLTAAIALAAILTLAPAPRTSAVATARASVGRSASSGRPAASGRGWLAVSPAARAAVSGALGRDERVYWARWAATGMVRWRNPTQGLRFDFIAGQLTVGSGASTLLGLSDLRLGRTGAALPPIRLAGVGESDNRLTLAATGLGESITNGPLGLEQSFKIDARPAGHGLLRVTQLVSGTAAGTVQAGGQSVTFGSRAGSLGYDDLVVTDARGRRLSADMQLAGRRLTIAIDDAGAAYPLWVDPTIASEATLTAAGGAGGAANGDYFGESVAISGSTIVVGAPEHDSGEGAVYVYTMPASGGWANATQTAELSASDGAAGDGLGTAVAVSGSKIVATAPDHATKGDHDRGAAYLWTEPTSGTWTDAEEPTELIASDGAPDDRLGTSVAISGPTVVVGESQVNDPFGNAHGRAYVWTNAARGVGERR